VPDPRATNPELFDLQNPKAPIPQFVNAMNMGGINLTPEQVANRITYEEHKDKDGNLFAVGIYNLDSDPSKTGEILEGSIPLFITQKNESGEWLWKNDQKYLLDKSNLYLGVSVEDRTHNELDIIKTSFNMAFVGYDTNWNNTEPTEGQIIYDYKYAHADRNVKWAVNNSLRVSAGPLFFVDTYPRWIKDGNFTKDQLEQIIVRRITTLMEHYKDQIEVWTVLNEYFPNQWSGVPYDVIQNKVGYDRYLELVYTTAQTVNPDAILIYNAGRNHTQSESDRTNGINYQHTIETIKKLKNMGIKNLAVGLQMHIDAKNPPSKETLIKTMISYGVPVYITELDVNLENIDPKNPNRLIIQADIYKEILEAAIESGVCDSITIFQILDKYSWLETDSGKINADPTPFNDSGNPKPAYYAILQAILEFIK